MEENSIPDVEVSKNERINISIWFVPIVALFISLWLAYQYFSQLGPEITIEFKSSSGLKAKQSQIKFRDVPIGTVNSISLKQGGKSVIVTARLNKDAQQFLNDNAKFWIVKPKIDKSGITGLETLVSGSYIELESKLGGSFKDSFIGLEEPYIDEEMLKGRYFKLTAPNSYDLESGSLVLYRNIKVGEIKHVKLSQDGEFVEFGIFIKEPYHKFVGRDTKFWNMSNFKLDISRATIDLSLASSSQIIYGAVSFTKSKEQNLTNQDIPSDYTFRLFSSKSEALKRALNKNRFGSIYSMTFKDSIGNLDIGAPILFDDFEIGEVIKKSSFFNVKNRKIESKILVTIDVDNYRDLDGFVAKLSKSNPILGNLHIELLDKSPSYKIIDAKPYPIFPTQETLFGSITDEISEVLSSIKNLVNESREPINSVVNNLNRVVKNIDLFVSDDELKSLPSNLTVSLKELQETLKSTQNLISSESKMSDDISESIKEINRASKSLERVLRKIDEKPNSIIFGD